MENLWADMVRTVVVGSERQAVSPATLAALGLEDAGDPARTALRALPAAWLLHRAAAPVPVAPDPLFPACLPDARPLCPPEVLQPLSAMVRHDAYPTVLPEFFELMSRRHWRLPPEMAPEVLNFLSRERLFLPAAHAAMGPVVHWLALQNPDWAFFLKKTKTAAPKPGIGTGKAPAADRRLRPDLPALPEPLWKRCTLDLLRDETLLESPDSALVHTLLEAEHRWPRKFLLAVWEYPLRRGYARQWAPPKHLRTLLQRAAHRCRPADALEIDPPAGDWPYAWHNELVQVRSVVQFRARLWDIFRF